MNFLYLQRKRLQAVSHREMDKITLLIWRIAFGEWNPQWRMELAIWAATAIREVLNSFGWIEAV